MEFEGVSEELKVKKEWLYGEVVEWVRRQEEEKRVKDVTKQLKGVDVNNNGESMISPGKLW